MRTIKFRGIKKNYFSDVREWLYGDLFHTTEDGDLCIQWWKLGFYNRAEVWPETVGEFTGLTDRNGNEIYEGDIVECVSWNEYFSDGNGKPLEPFRRRMYVDFRNGGFKMVEPMPEPMKDNEWDIIYNGDIEVIGNIHENEEILNR